ncbi:Aldehyde dehydrogenase family 3 member A2 [Halotydeus destructor]|nr:Aldehyde dehydrogenase family 3 member A2 [Halotydeus destructor]
MAAESFAMEHIPKMVAIARDAFKTHRTKDVEFRRHQLNQLMKLLEEKEQLILDALKKDFAKPDFESIAFETYYVRNSIKGVLHSLDQWVKPVPVAKEMMTMFDSPVIMYEPYGTVLIIAPWNYPIMLTFSPLIGAIAAGNCAILKPSELVPNTTSLLAELIPEYMDKECYQVITGGPEETQFLLKEKFDYIFYTGSTRVGQLVYEAAAKHLTPVTLELGGKSPVIIDDSVTDLETTARRLLWGKWANAGQTCIAPDYVLCSAKVQEKLVQHAAAILKGFSGNNANNNYNGDYCAIVTDNHFKRLETLIKTSKGDIALGGNCDAGSRKIEPTVVTNVQSDDSLMKDELFGPILPIMTIKSTEEAINYINSNEKPLALYIFSTDEAMTNKVLRETSSGAVCVNDVILQFTVGDFPFGGVGASGIGKYHGKHSFELFSNNKPVLTRGFAPVLERLANFRYPPYTDDKLAAFKAISAKSTGLIPENSMALTMNMVSAATSVGMEKFWKLFY